MARWTNTLAPWMVDVAEKLYEEGKYDADVAAYLKVTRSTLSRWFSQGADEDCDDDLLVDFVQRCNEARAKANANLDAIWDLHVQNDPRACAVAMRARRPEEYNQEQKVKVESTVTTAKPLAETDFTAEELRAMRANELIFQAARERKALNRG